MRSCFGVFEIALATLCLCLPMAVFADDAATFALTNGETVSTFDSFRECDVCPDMIVLPQGSFMMGAREGESWSSLWDDWGERKGPVGQEGPDDLYNLPHEGPQHRV